MNEITSSQNPVVKEVRSLKSRKDREERGLFFVEGVRIVEEALSAAAPVKYIIMSRTFAGEPGGVIPGSLRGKPDTKCYVIPDNLFETLGDTRTPQGILAVLEAVPARLHDADFSNALFVLLENIKDPGNMGTIIRTADAAGFTGVIATGGCVDVYNPKVLRSTMGSVFHLPVYYEENISETIDLLKSKGIGIAASHLSADCTVYEADLTQPAALVVGSEADGISRVVESAADLLVKIPMPGNAESLNASVAAAVMMFEAVRQRYREGKPDFLQRRCFK